MDDNVLNYVFPITSDEIEPSELQKILMPIFEEDNRVILEITSNSDNNRLVSPELLIGLAGPVGAFIGTFLTLLIQSLKDYYSKKMDHEFHNITIKGKNGAQISFPLNTPPDKIEDLLNYVTKLDGLTGIVIKNELTE